MAPGKITDFRVLVENVGGDVTDGEIYVKNTLPAGLTSSNIYFSYIGIASQHEFAGGGLNYNGNGLNSYFCPNAGTGTRTAECQFPAIFGFYCHEFGIYCENAGLQPGEKLLLAAKAEVPMGMEGTLEDTAEAEGGGSAPASGTGTMEATPNPQFGNLGFHASATNAAGEPYRQAGGHPYEFSTEFNFATTSCVNSEEEQSGPDFGKCPLYDPRDITSDLPPGLIVNPQGVPHCNLADYFAGECERLKVAVGTADLGLYGLSSTRFKFIEPVLNLQPAGEYPGQLGVLVAEAPFIVITSGVRDGSDYGVTATTTGIQSGLNASRLNLWGVPADPAHDPFRGKSCGGFGDGAPGTYYDVAEDYLTLAELEEWCALENTVGGDPSNAGGPAETEEKPFVTMPTECSGQPIPIDGRYDTWQLPGNYAQEGDQLEAVEGCNVLQFNPTIESRPTTNLADAPSGLEFNLHVPQDEDPVGVATPELKESVVKLPPGLTLSPASANGRQGCTEAEVSLHVEGPSNCPNASKLGEVEIESSLLHEPLKGSLFLATPHQNPFGSLFAVYISVSGRGCGSSCRAASKPTRRPGRSRPSSPTTRSCPSKS